MFRTSMSFYTDTFVLTMGIITNFMYIGTDLKKVSVLLVQVAMNNIVPQEIQHM